MSMLLMANLLDLARHSFAIHRRRRRGGADYDGSHFIDVHAHFLPDFYVKEMSRAGITDVDGWPLPGWSAGAAIDVMDRHGIAAQTFPKVMTRLGRERGVRAGDRLGPGRDRRRQHDREGGEPACRRHGRTRGRGRRRGPEQGPGSGQSGRPCSGVAVR